MCQQGLQLTTLFEEHVNGEVTGSTESMSAIWEASMTLIYTKQIAKAKLLMSAKNG